MTDTTAAGRTTATMPDRWSRGVVAVARAVAIGASLTCVLAWSVAHRQAQPMEPSLARAGAIAWCGYNFPLSDPAVDPNSNNYACALGFVGGARDPEETADHLESQLAAIRDLVGADHPQGMWRVAFLAGWRAGQEAAGAR
jgi:hypothetical protein